MRILVGTVILLLSTAIAAADDVKEGFSPRLKYKKGPVCMCNEGLKEKDIRDAMQKREREKRDGFSTIIKPDDTLRDGGAKEE